MNLYQCQREAKDLGYDNVIFDITFPSGKFEARWLDAYMGLFTINAPGMGKGFVTVRQIDEMFPNVECENLRGFED